MSVRLSLAALPALPDGIARPAYSREAQSPGILHVGTGNFHRAHQAVYLDDLFNRGRDLDWAIIGAGVRPHDAAMRERLAAQDWLTTVVELEPGANSARVTGAMIGFAAVAPGNAPLIAAMSDPAIRIVSLTVTEGGYCINPATGAFDPDHPEIRADLAAPQAPTTVFGAILAALRTRRAAGIAPFTVMSCDNLPRNGQVTREAVTGLAALLDRDFAAWIAEKVAFPDSMVDRITPATTESDRAALAARFGFEDAWPVFCEPFRQWVLEDHFPAGRPALEEVGVTFSDQVAAFELMKLHILNGGHAIIAYPAALLGLKMVDEAMAHPLVAGFLRKVAEEEVLPVVPPVPGTDLSAYLRQIETRFANADVRDTVPRLCADGSNRQPKFILPSIRDRLARGAGIRGLALETALWCRYCHGETEAGAPVTLEDGNAARLTAAARRARETPLAFLELGDIFGDLARTPAYREAFAAALQSLWREGVARTLETYLRDGAA
ncbi:MAG TPA: mannitol dehydrogenase family protein [Paracoccaceae bacterium]|nr:mannitol dehydrogenase family protein [Paracoccaceae bacterium]